MTILKNSKALDKAIAKTGIKTGAANPTFWISTGNMALNKIISKKYSVGIPNKKSFLYWGPQGSGKSYLLQKAALEAQKAGYYIFYFDTEHSVDDEYFYNIGLTGFEDNSLMRIMQITTLEELYDVTNEIFKNIDIDQKFFIGIDSLSNLILEKNIKDYTSGKVKGDQGQTSKQLKMFTKLMNKYVKQYDMFLGCTGHAYINQDLTNGKGPYIFSGGEGVEFNFSTATFVNKFMLKDVAGTPLGVRIKTKTTKTRFNQLGLAAELKLPYEEGLTEWDGLIEDLVNDGVLTKNGGWYSYINSKGESVKFQGENRLGDYYLDILKETLEKEAKWLKNEKDEH